MKSSFEEEDLDREEKEMHCSASSAVLVRFPPKRGCHWAVFGET